MKLLTAKRLVLTLGFSLSFICTSLVYSQDSSQEIEAENNLTEATPENDLKANHSDEELNQQIQSATDQESVDDESAEVALDVNETETAKESLFDPQLIAEIEALRARLSDIAVTESPYSLRLAESYSEYGALLYKAKRYEEALRAFADALHIQKVNHGIYAVEQYNSLSMMVEIARAMDLDKKMEAYLGRALMIDKKVGDVDNADVVNMFVQAGHYYLDQYYKSAREFEIRVAHLKKARQYFEHVVDHHGQSPLSERSLPYGELLLVSYLESTQINLLPISNSRDNGLFLTRPNRNQQNAYSDERLISRYVQKSFDRSSKYIQGYLQKAKQEQNQVEIVNALLASADTHLLFGYRQNAASLYKLVWQEAQKLPSDQALVSRLENPTIIPNYDYLLDRNQRIAETLLGPMSLSFSLSKEGRVANIEVMSAEKTTRRSVFSARVAFSELRFRPPIVAGEMVAAEQVTFPSVLEE